MIPPAHDTEGEHATPLPVPTRVRFQPLRLGLVELFHYDCEEFWFRDGHLLLRGNNGTGKSKVLSLTLPFLLDAQLLPSRVEPDGDRTKRMDWNLLMGRHERRTGYTWIEFGRRAEDGTEHYVTLGCGLRAVAGRGRVESWPFVTELRMGQDLFLISAERNVLTRDRLKDALGDRGQVCESAKEYQRAVDERLFRLGDRYEGLIETLIQLRQPQLSRKPDEGSLSEALTQALPELSKVVLEDVADAMNQLDEYRDELVQIERVAGAVSHFGKRYGVYAQIQARRQARVLRQAQTEFDNQSRALSEARADLEAAQAATQQHQRESERLESKLRADRAALDELRSDPAMSDARRLDDLEANAKSRTRDHAAAEARVRASETAYEREQTQSAQRARELDAALARLAKCVTDTANEASAAGILSDHDTLLAPTLNEAEFGTGYDTLQRALRSCAERRTGQTEQLRRQLVACDKRERERDQVAANCDVLRVLLEDATEHAQQAEATLETRSNETLRAWRTYIAGLQVLALREPETGLTELALWVQTLSGEQPLRTALALAQRAAEERLATRSASIAQRRSALKQEDDLLREEERAMGEGEELTPPVSATRSVEARTGRLGAPLWQLLEFREHVSPAERANLEAALEGAAVLDAWVTPEGVLLHPDTRDAWLEPGVPRARSLRDWLCPGPSERGVADARLEALLASVACAYDEDLSADSWLSPNGQFRVGRLRGAFQKSEPEYIGYAARDNARKRRLAEIALRRAELADALASIAAERAALEAQRTTLDGELARAPKDDELRSAHARHSDSIKQQRAALERLAAKEADLERAAGALREARAARDRDAHDLHLPTDPTALSIVERAIEAYRQRVQTLVHALETRGRSMFELAQQRAREHNVQDELQQNRQNAEERGRELADTMTRLQLLREASLAAVSELRRRLAAVQEAVALGECKAEEARDELALARERRASGEQRTVDSQQRLEERSTARNTAAERLQRFAATGLLGQALPDLEQPEGASWQVDPALQLARRIEQQLAKVSSEEHDWTRVQTEISRDYTDLGRVLSELGQTAQMEQSEFGLLVQVLYGNRVTRPGELVRTLAVEVEQRKSILSAREREILENHLQAEVAANLQRLLREAEARVERINAELKQRPTTTGVYFRLDWEGLPEGDDGAPVGLAEARTRLLRRAADAWSPEDRAVVGEFLQTRIEAERALDDSGPLVDHLARALDYRRWHRFRVKRWHDGAFRPLSGPASSGERALGLTVPLFAAASSHYGSGASPYAPRLVLLDEAFAGIDDEARAHCMGLIHAFDLDFVMTSEREWGCYATLPGVSICQVVRREGIDAVFVSRWTWDGSARRVEADPSRRFPAPAAATP